MRGDALPHASPGLGVCVCLTVGSNAVLGARGAQWGEKFGWERPNFFCPGASEDEIQRLKEYSYGHGNWMEAVGKEVDACRNSVAIFDQSSFSKFAVQGRDAAQVTYVPPAITCVPFVTDHSRHAWLPPPLLLLLLVLAWRTWWVHGRSRRC